MNKRRVLTALLASGSVILLSACGSTEEESIGDQPTATAVASVNTAPVVVGEVVVAEAESPAGFSYEDVGAILAESGPEGDDEDVLGVLSGITGNMVTEPPQCAPLIPTAIEILTRLAEDPEHNAASEYASADGEAVISVVVTTGETHRAPQEVADCATITRTMGMDDFQTTITYAATPREVDIAGADTITSAHVASTDSEFESAAVDAVMVAGAVGDAYFHINADGPVDEAVIDDLARAQVDKISNR